MKQMGKSKRKLDLERKLRQARSVEDDDSLAAHMLELELRTLIL